MRYEVREVRNDDLPERQEWALAQCGECVMLFVKKRSAALMEVYAEAWAAYRLMAEAEPRSLRLLRSGT